MTTAHKPTWHPAVGGEHAGSYRYLAPRAQFSVRDMPSHTALKVRARARWCAAVAAGRERETMRGVCLCVCARAVQVRQSGQSAPEDLAARDFKRELEQREAAHFHKILDGAPLPPWRARTVERLRLTSRSLLAPSARAQTRGSRASSHTAPMVRSACAILAHAR